jgi:hypothetical protein
MRLNPLPYIARSVGFIKERLSERSTYITISTGMVPLAVLPTPWSYVGFGLIVAMAMTPQAPHGEGGAPPLSDTSTETT